MRCPYCGKKKAKIDVKELRSGAMIHSAVHCSNPECSTYDPALFESHRNTDLETPRPSTKRRDSATRF